MRTEDTAGGSDNEFPAIRTEADGEAPAIETVRDEATDGTSAQLASESSPECTEEENASALGETALAYAEAGYPVLPLFEPKEDGTCSCGAEACDKAGKHPRVAGGAKSATTDAEKIRGWWRRWRSANLGIATGGASGLVALDVDGPEGLASLSALEAEHGPLPATRRHATARGQHYLFWAPDGVSVKNSAGALGQGLDVRGDGGYIVAPPSKHVSGVAYELVSGEDGSVAEVAPMPDGLLKLLFGNRNSGEGAGEAAGDEAPIPEGSRNTTLTIVGGRLRAEGKTRHGIYEALSKVNKERCEPPLPDDEVKAIAASLAKYPPRKRVRLAVPQHRQRPELEVTGDTHQLAEIIGQHVAASNSPPELFEMERTMVRVLPTAAGAKVAPVDKMLLRVHVGARVRLFRNVHGKDGPRKEYTEVTSDQATFILAMDGWGLPQLRGIALHPIFTADGELVAEHGYSQSGEIFVDLGDLDLPTVPDVPDEQDVQSAKAMLLEEFLGDFPFVDEASRAHAVALGLVPLVRDMIDGPVPGHMVEATSEGSGKTLLVRAVIQAVTGIDPCLTTELSNDDEWRKSLTAMLVDLPEVLVFDNVKRTLDSPALATVMTSKHWEGRRLGETDMIRVPVRVVFVFTGNNPTMSREVARRMVMTRLDAKTENPWLRSGFLHNPILPWVAANRGDLLWAFLVLVQNWVALGRPRSKATKGSFEEWSAVVGGILEAAGIPGFLANEADFFDRSDTETAAWKEFVRLWWAKHQRRPVGVSDLYDLAEEHEVLLDQLGGTNERSQKSRLGKQLVHRIGRIVAGKRIAMASEDGHVKVNRYQLEDPAESGDVGGTSGAEVPPASGQAP
jgi:hypothetical protein